MENEVESWEFKIMDRYPLYTLLQLIVIGIGLVLAVLFKNHVNHKYILIICILAVLGINLLIAHQMEPLCRFELDAIGLRQIYLRKIFWIKMDDRVIPFIDIKTYESGTYYLKFRLRSDGQHRLNYYQPTLYRRNNEIEFNNFKSKLLNKIDEFNKLSSKGDQVVEADNFFQTYKAKAAIAIVVLLLVFITYALTYKKLGYVEDTQVILGYFLGIAFIVVMAVGIRFYKK
jgi:hypothetical protein